MSGPLFRWVRGSLVLAAGVLLGLAASRAPAWVESKQADRELALIQQIESLSELVTVKYVIEKIVSVEDIRWYGENRVLLAAHGVVKAGIDLGELGSENVIVEGERVTVRLPAPVITDVYLDDAKTRVLERSTGLLRTYDRDLEQDARRRAAEHIRRAAEQEGIEQDALERARQQLGDLIRRFGYAEVLFDPPG